jgi:1,4-dihydroxy-6-naphthoate synthase
MKLSLGFSPCPNDTFIFDAMVNGRIDPGPFRFDVHLEDVETLNELAFRGQLDITKLSFHAFAHLTSTYQLLSSGSALGKGVGPLLIFSREKMPARHSDWRVAIPGQWTTAHLLLKLFYPDITHKTPMAFHKIEDAVASGDFDAGVIIHENRFTYREKGLTLIQDLGAAWEMKFDIPIPLGGIAIKRSLPDSVKRQIQTLLHLSVLEARAYPDRTVDYVTEHAQSMDPAVRQQHIDLYVNKYTVDLGEEGIKAIRHMLDLLVQQGDVEGITEPWWA